MIEEILKVSKRTHCPDALLEIPFAEGFWSWTEAAEDCLKKKVGDTLDLLLPSAVFSLKHSLVERWAKVAAPSLLLEMRIASDQNKLKGRTSEQKYHDFLRKTFWDEKGLRAFFEEYREIARYIALFLEQWVEHHAVFLMRLKDNFPLLEMAFNQNRPLGKVSFLSKNLSDFHHGGRSVLALGFEHGARFLYKPKNLGIAHAFYSLLSTLNQQGLSPHFKTYTILVREGYGWEEKIEQTPCQNQQEADRYFERAGMLICLYYLLHGTDAHQENLIASEEHPFLVDLETLFHGALQCENPIDEKIYEHSVLSTLFLPSFRVEKSKKQGADVGGLTGGKDRVTSSKIIWENLGTSEMRMVSESRSLPCFQNHLVLQGVVQDAGDYVNLIVLGFRKMYQFVQNKRALFLGENGWINKLAEHHVRFVFRPTRIYCNLLGHLTSPQTSLNESERTKKLMLLEECAVGKEQHLALIVKQEQKSLLNGDIPHFLASPKTAALYSGSSLIAENCFKTIALDVVERRFQGMNQHECELQEKLIRLSYEPRP